MEHLTGPNDSKREFCGSIKRNQSRIREGLPLYYDKHSIEQKLTFA
jgi:hypothetical protein